MGFVAELAEVRERLTVLGQRFDPDPGVAAAARSGELSAEQTEAIAAAVEAKPGSGGRAVGGG